MLDWEVTMKCNLDCDYCRSGIHGGHDNTQKHPKLEDCEKTIDFMFEYVDIIMAQRIKSLRTVVLNVYGGEALNHPKIVDIFTVIRKKHQSYSTSWKLQVTTTTNLILPAKKLEKIIPLVDEFTVSYHANNTDKQKNQFRQNILKIKQNSVPVKCVVLMHAEPKLFADAQDIINWCKQHDVKHLPRQLDRVEWSKQFDYDKKQVYWFEKLYQNASHKTEPIALAPTSDKTNLTAIGRACCGGRQLCKDSNFRERHFFVDNKFPDWYCSVDKFFLYVKQVNGEVYFNKDCKMAYNGQVGSIGNLDNTEKILSQQKCQTSTIQCKKTRCYCGLCAPKAKDLDTFNQIMLKYQL